MQEIEVNLTEGRIVPMQPTQSPKIFIKKLENEHNIPYITTSYGQPLLQGAKWTAIITGSEDINEMAKQLKKLITKDPRFLDNLKNLHEYSHQVTTGLFLQYFRKNCFVF
jgi:hypothetical protein